MTVDSIERWTVNYTPSTGKCRGLAVNDLLLCQRNWKLLLQNAPNHPHQVQYDLKIILLLIIILITIMVIIISQFLDNDLNKR